MNDYKGFKSQALDFNVYSDGVSVSSVVQEFALAPENPETSGPFYEIKEGEGENAVTIWEIKWLDSPPPYTDYPTRIDSSTEITSEGKNFYWERQITYYSDNPEKPFPGTPSKSTMLDVDFINALGITAKKITVLQNNTEAKSTENRIIFEADGFNEAGTVKIGGFEVDSNSLSTGGGIDRVIIKSNTTSTITPEDIPTTAGGGDGVYRPEDGNTYILLDYIESTGKEYIDLGIQAKNIANATLDFIYTDVVSSGAALDANKYNAIYGTDAGIQIARSETGQFTNGAGVKGVVLDLNTRYICKATYNYFADPQSDVVGTGQLELWQHGQTSGTPIDTLTRNLSKVTTEGAVPNVYLFSAFDNDIPGAAYFSKAKIYSCKINNIVDAGENSYEHEFLPVLQVETSTPGLYDIKTNTFYANKSNQGNFIAGSIAEIVPIERIAIALGAEESNEAPFRVTNKGEVTATKGKIGGFTIGANSIASGSGSTGIQLTSTDGTDGNAKVIQAGTNFSVDADGKIVSTGGKIGGLDISTRTLTGRLYNSAESALKGVELGITTANHIVPLTAAPPDPNSGYSLGSAEEKSIDNITLSNFGYESQVTTTTSGDTTTQVTKELNWTLYWTSEEQPGGTYIYKAFRSISDKNVDMGKPFERITEVSITQINDNGPATGLNYENIYTPDPDDVTKAWIAEIRVTGSEEVTGWEESKRTYTVTTSNSSYDNSIQVSPAIRFMTSGDSKNLTVSTGYLFTTSVQPSEDFKITNIYTDGEIKTLQPARTITATAVVATAGFWTATSTVSSSYLRWLTTNTPTFYVNQKPYNVTNESGTLEDHRLLNTSGIKLNSSWRSEPYPSTDPSKDYYKITIEVTYSDIPYNKPILTTNVTYRLTDAAITNNYALYVGAPFTSSASAAYDEAPFKVRHDGTLELSKEISITSTGEVLSDSWLEQTSSGYFNRITPGRLSVESSYNDGGGFETGDNWGTYSQFGAIGVRNYTSSNLDVNNFMNSSSVPILASEVTNSSPASFVIAANTKAVHNLRPHHGQVYIQGIVRPSYEGEDSSVSLTIGKRTNSRDFLSAAVKQDRSIKITPAEIISGGNWTSTLSGNWQADSFTSTGSDAKLKHKIEHLPNEYTSLFDNLKPVRFKYNNGTSNRYHTGFIAQDVEQAILGSGLTTNDVAGYIKEADTVNDNGVVTKEGTRSIRYEEFVALNTDQIQKLKTRVTELEATVEELTKLINEKLNVSSTSNNQ